LKTRSGLARNQNLPFLDGHYLAARSLLINGRPQRSIRTIAKAIYYSYGHHEDMALYQEVLGDALRAQNVPSKAKRAYEAGVYAANAAGQKKIARRLQRKINSLARQFSTPRGGR